MKTSIIMIIYILHFPELDSSFAIIVFSVSRLIFEVVDSNWFSISSSSRIWD